MFDTFAFKGQKIINEPLVEYRDKIMSKCNLKKKTVKKKITGGLYQKTFALEPEV